MTYQLTINPSNHIWLLWQSVPDGWEILLISDASRPKGANEKNIERTAGGNYRHFFSDDVVSRAAMLFNLLPAAEARKIIAQLVNENEAGPCTAA